MTITKIVSGNKLQAAVAANELYAEIIGARSWFASGMRIAEAAKVIENTQRRLNIALVKEKHWGNIKMFILNKLFCCQQRFKYHTSLCQKHCG